MIIYKAIPRAEKIKMMLRICDSILSSYYYNSTQKEEIKPLQTIIKHNERIRNEAKKKRADAGT